jgi:hypothetical protein
MAEAPLPLFYKEPRPLSSARDADTSLRIADNQRFAAGTNSVPLVAAEFAAACRAYPIVFTGDDTPLPVALLGLRKAENLFIDAEGRWEPNVYVPAYVRRYPFIFMENKETGQFTLCVDAAAEGVVPGRENPFFADGKPAEITNTALNFVRDYQVQAKLTEEFATALAEAGLLVDRRADVTLASGEKIGLAGFKAIDEEKFGALPAATVQDWHTRGWLALAYAALISAAGWPGLIERENRRRAQ